MIKKALILIVVALIAVEAEAATRLVYWTFEEATTVDATCGDVSSCDGAHQTIYTETNPVSTDQSPQGGKNLRGLVDSAGSGYTQPKIWNDEAEWGLIEFYISYWANYETDLSMCDSLSPFDPANCEIESIKMCKVKCGSSMIENTSGGCDFTINQYGTSFSLYLTSDHNGDSNHNNDNGRGTAAGAYAGITEGEWQKYGIYAKYNTSVDVINDTSYDLTFNDNDPSNDTIVDAGSRFISSGWEVGMRVLVLGSTSNNNSYSKVSDQLYTVTAVTASTLTLDSGDDLTDETCSNEGAQIGGGKFDGILKIWFDFDDPNSDTPKWTKTNTFYRWSNEYVADGFGVIQHIKTSGSDAGSVYGHVRFDMVEFWDGMPTGNVKGVTIY